MHRTVFKKYSDVTVSTNSGYSDVFFFYQNYEVDTKLSAISIVLLLDYMQSIVL